MATKTTPARTRGSSRKNVYEALRTEILSLVLRPGQLLDETELAERFGLSRSPIREALIRLSSEGLVVTTANRSTVVAPIEISSFPRYVEALDIIQRVVMRLAAELRTPADIALIAERQKQFEQSIKAGKYLAMSEANKQFHLAIAKAGKNSYLASFYEQLLNQGQRMLHLHFEFLERTPGSYLLTDDHQHILQAIIDQDVSRAEDLGHEHTRQFRDNFISFMMENYVTDISLAPKP